MLNLKETSAVGAVGDLIVIYSSSDSNVLDNNITKHLDLKSYKFISDEIIYTDKKFDPKNDKLYLIADSSDVDLDHIARIFKQLAADMIDISDEKYMSEIEDIYNSYPGFSFLILKDGNYKNFVDMKIDDVLYVFASRDGVKKFMKCRLYDDPRPTHSSPDVLALCYSPEDSNEMFICNVSKTGSVFKSYVVKSGLYYLISNITLSTKVRRTFIYSTSLDKLRRLMKEYCNEDLDKYI